MLRLLKGEKGFRRNSRRARRFRAVSNTIASWNAILLLIAAGGKRWHVRARSRRERMPPPPSFVANDDCHSDPSLSMAVYCIVWNVVISTLSGLYQNRHPHGSILFNIVSIYSDPKQTVGLRAGRI